MLGPPHIIWGEEALHIPRRRARALLFRLAARLEPIARDELAFLFWPDHPSSLARRNLTHLLTHLRSALPDPDLVIVAKDHIGLNPVRCWSDAAEFERLLAGRKELSLAAQGLEADLQPALGAVEAGVQSYRGALLSGFALPGCPEFEAWISRERQGYECHYLEALLDLVDFYQANQELTTAIGYAKRYLESDNLAESVHCRLIELFAQQGDRSAAERQLEQCTEALEHELGISPSPKTWAIYQAVMGSGQAGLMLPSQAMADRSRFAHETPFVGRNEVLEQVERIFNLARLGRGKVCLISGEPGIGKSRLLRQIAAHYRCQSSVLYSAGNPGMEDLPYHPIAEAMRSALEGHAASLKKVSPVWLAEAGRLLPEIYGRFPDLPEPLPARPEEARRRLFEALYQLSAGLASRVNPLLLCLDDLHWADTTTLEWLIYLGNRLAFEGSSYLLVICACRSEGLQSLDGLRYALNRLGVLEELQLEALEAEHVLEILGQLSTPNQHNQGLASRLQQISGGNPYFLCETLRALIEEHHLATRLVEPENIPLLKNIQAIVGQRLVGLEQGQQKVLEIAAVLNRVLTFDFLRRGAESSEAELLDILEHLTKRHLLTEQAGRYQFQHDLVRVAIYDRLSYDRKRFLHRQCGRILEELAPADYGALAWHFEQGGEVSKAGEYALRAGENALKVYAFREALEFYSRALNLLKQESAALTTPGEIAANQRKQIQALSGRGNAFRALGDMQAYQNDFEEEGRIARVLDDKNALAHIYLREAKAHRWFCRYPEALSCAEQALHMGQRSGNALLQARALRQIGLVKRASGDYSNAQAVLQDALQRFKELDEAAYEIYTLCNLSRLFAYSGEFKRAEQFAASALSRCDLAQLPYLRRIALGDLGLALGGSGLNKQARECLLASLEMARQIADRTQEIFCMCNLGYLENHAGRPEEALAYLRDGLALAERLDSRAEQSRLYSGIAEAHRLLHNTRLAKAFAFNALDLAKKHGRVVDQNLAQQILNAIQESS
jgi:DNA-binding SARP family transcriptional activator